MNTDTSVFPGTFQADEDGERDAGPLWVPCSTLKTDVVGVFRTEFAKEASSAWTGHVGALLY